MGRKILNKTGEKCQTILYGEVIIVEYFNALNCTIQFSDGTVLEKVQYANIEKGTKNPNTPSLFNVGYLRQGKYAVGGTFKKFTNHYSVWSGIIKRCYSTVCQKRQSTYIECLVVEEWHNFQNFGKWYYENWKSHMIGWQLDKDILCPNCKIYSPETCCFVPQEINSLFTKCNSVRGEYPIGVSLWKKEGTFSAHLMIRGVKKYLGTFKTPEEAFRAYKTAKEQYIREVADKWKSQINDKVYQAMYNYKVEVTD